MSGSFPPAAMDSLGRVVETGRVPLWVAEEGAGAPLILLGGFTAGHYVFELVWPALRASNRLVAIEPRGLGQSARPDPTVSPYDVDVWAEDLRAALDALQIERANVWAQGFASYYALRFAARWPSRVGALISYTDVWAADPGKRYAAIWEVYRAVVEQFGVRGFGARMLASLFDVPSPAWFYAWEQRNIEAILHQDTVAATVGYCLTVADVRDDLERVEAPVLVLQGQGGWRGEHERDEDLSLQLMRERLARVDVAVIPDAHPGYALVQRPHECAQIVQRHLDESAPEAVTA